MLTTATVLFLASVITFGLGALSKSNPAATVLGETATPEDIAAMNAQFGLDQPLVPRYFTWLGHALQGDLGTSWFTTVPVSDSHQAGAARRPLHRALALVLAIVLGGGAGIVAALRAGGLVDRAVTVVCSVVATLPPFVIGIALIVILAVKARLLPAGGYVALDVDPVQWLRFSILPALALSIEVAANIARQLRTSLVFSLAENYAIGAEMRGYSRRRVLFGHVLRNAVSPTLAVIGMALPLIIGGAVMTEKLFNLPGIAQLALQSADPRRRARRPRHPARDRRDRAGRQPGRQRAPGRCSTPPPAAPAPRRDADDHRPQPAPHPRRPGGPGDPRRGRPGRGVRRLPRAVRPAPAVPPILPGPSGDHWLGTDYVGRDVLSRLMAGTRLSVIGALEAVAVGLALGVPTGLLSVWAGRAGEWVSLRVSDTLMMLPFTVFAIAVAGTLGNGLHQAMIAVGVLTSPGFFRITRAVALGLRTTQYVEAAELMGASRWWTLRTHIWSKVLPNVAVAGAHAMGSALLIVASLAFLGLGIIPPRRPGAACSPPTSASSSSRPGRRSSPGCCWS